MIKIFKLIHTIFFYLFLISYSCIISILLITFSFLKLKKLCEIIITIWGKGIIISTGSKVTVKGIEYLDKNKIYLFCPNHSSSFDIYLINGYLNHNFVWISKGLYFKIPLIGKAMKALGFINIDRSNPKKSFKSLKLAAEKIQKENLSVVIFPEGTRSIDGKIQDFKRGSLYISLLTQCEIVPVTIKGTYNILPKNKFLIQKTDIELIFSKPIQPPEKNKTSQFNTLKKLKDEIENNFY